MFRVVKHRKKGFCQAHACPKKSTERDRFCPKHRHRYNKYMRPIAYCYNSLKSNAKRRGKDFDLTLEEFRIFCEETGYIDNKGKRKDSATIDRKDASKGYSLGNLQILSLEENSRKGAEEKAPF